ncbi:hypothetical protein CYMTET_37709 [Cymbomonas tetramitiformis]|uniref:Amine oxidase domain-containing protein n=1 Tax=Cymbomonas tetramitiformis TaxID=36881 RepID=A0AAE0CDE5_9CHLO|nr:hypothetical protein CYMTET_37709 [Cymbomonas tetramitiformis]
MSVFMTSAHRTGSGTPEHHMVIVIGLGIGGMQIADLVSDEEGMTVCGIEGSADVGGLIVTEKGHNMGPSYHLEGHTHLNNLLTKNNAKCGCFEELDPNSTIFYSTRRGEDAVVHAAEYAAATQILEELAEKTKHEALKDVADEKQKTILRKAVPWYREMADYELNRQDSALQRKKCVCGDYRNALVTPLYTRLKNKHQQVRLHFNKEVDTIDKTDQDWIVRSNNDAYKCAYLVVAAPVAALQKFKLGEKVPSAVKQYIAYLNETITPKASMRVFVKLKNPTLAAKAREAAGEMLKTHGVSYLHVLTTVAEFQRVSPLWSMIFEPQATDDCYNFLLAYCDSDAAAQLNKKRDKNKKFYDNLLRTVLVESFGIHKDETIGAIDADYIDYHSPNAYHVWDPDTDLSEHITYTDSISTKHRIIKSPTPV